MRGSSFGDVVDERLAVGTRALVARSRRTVVRVPRLRGALLRAREATLWNAPTVVDRSSRAAVHADYLDSHEFAAVDHVSFRFESAVVNVLSAATKSMFFPLRPIVSVFPAVSLNSS